MRFGLGDGSEHTLEEVGQNFAVTRERIRQIEAKALRKLRHPSPLPQAEGVPGGQPDLKPLGGQADRRGFLEAALGATVAAASARAATASGTQAAPEAPKGPARIRFAAIGLNHGHINGQTEAVMRGGGELVSFYAKEPDLVAAYQKRFPQAKLARSEQEILEDPKIQLVVSASIANERAPLGVRVMRAGQGLHGRQARHHDARPARRGAQGPEGDEAHLLDLLQRAAREPCHRRARASW